MRSKYAYRDEWYRDIIDTPSSYYIEPFQIAGNLFFVGTKDSASHVIDTGEGLILIDTGYPNMGGHLRMQSGNVVLFRRISRLFSIHMVISTILGILRL